MEDYPKSTLEFEHRFATEEACRAYVVKLRWPDGVRCPRCNSKQTWKTQRGLYRCARCDYQISITSGTILEGTRKPLRVWFRAMWFVVGQKQGVSALGLQRVLEIQRYETVWMWLHKLRRAMVRPGRDRLSGVVEVDEAYVGGKRKGKRGRGAEGKSLVIIAAQEDGKRIGRIRLVRVADASSSSLESAIIKMVSPGSMIRTDGWKGYNGLVKIGYQRSIARKEDCVGDNLLPMVNRVVSLLKRWLLGTHQGAIRKSHLDFYLDEFTFRFNRRTSRSRGKLFYRLIQQALNIGPIAWSEIRGGTSDSGNHNI